MVKVEIVTSLVTEIKKKFNRIEANNIINMIESVESHPSKGKKLGTVGGIIIKELKYKGFRFYFLADGYKLKFMRKEDLSDLILTFVRMSDKKTQAKVIDEIKRVLILLGQEGF